MKLKDGKMNSYSFDESKKQFYNNLKTRKEEIENELEAAKEASDFYDFNTWELANGEYKFLKDTLGPIYYDGVPQFDYNGLLHLPKIKWVDSDGDEHIHALIGTHSPGYYGFMSPTNVMSQNNTIDINVIEPNEDCEGHKDDRKISLAVNTDVIQKKLTAGTGIHISSDNVISADALEDGNVGYDLDTKALFVKRNGEYVPITALNLVEDEKIRAELVENNKIDLLGDEPFSHDAYNFPFHIADLRYDTSDSKLKATLHTITLDNNKTRKSYPLEVEIPTGTGGVTQEYVDTQDQAVKAYADEKLDGKLDLLGDVPGWAPGTNPYKLSYYYEMIPSADKVTVKAKTVSLDNKKDQGEYSLTVPGATTTTAGLMTAADKIKLGNSQTKVVYSSTEPSGSQDGDIWIF